MPSVSNFFLQVVVVYRRHKSHTLTAREFRVLTFPFWIVDFGNATLVTFGYANGQLEQAVPAGTTVTGTTIQRGLPFTSGLNQLSVGLSDGTNLPLWLGPNPASVPEQLDSLTSAIVRDFTWELDPLVDTFTGADQIEAFRSFTKSINLLRVGTISVIKPPFPATFMNSAFKFVGGSRCFWRQQSRASQIKVSPVNEASHKKRSPEIAIFLPPAGSYPVVVTIPNFVINPSGLAYTQNGTVVAYFWAAQITATVELNTYLGEVK